MKRSTFFFLILIVFRVHGQEWQDFKWNQTKSKLKYHIVNQGNGKQIAEDDSVTINFIWYDEGDKHTLFTTYNPKIPPQTFIPGNSAYVKGFQEAVKLLNEKGSGFFIIPPKLAYGKEGLQGQKTFHYYIEVVKIRGKNNSP